MEFKLNVPKADMMSYRHFVRGEAKIGKTTLFRDIIIEHYGSPEYGILIATGNEFGYKAISNLYAVEANSWGNFVEAIDKLIDDKENHKFEIVAIDTVDQLVEIAEKEAIRVHLKRTGVRVSSINEAMSGYGRGQKYARKIITDQLARLERAGFGIFFIGHTKVRDIEEKGTDVSYQQLQGNLEGKYNSLFTDMVDIVATMISEKTIDGNKIDKITRWIYFRGDGFVEAGTRFPKIKNRVELSAKNYIGAIEEAIELSFGENVSKNEIETIKQEEVEAKKEEAEEYIRKEQTGSVDNAEQLNTIDDYIRVIGERVAELSPEMKRQIREELNEEDIDVTSYKQEKDIEILKYILRAITSLG